MDEIKAYDRANAIYFGACLFLAYEAFITMGHFIMWVFTALIIVLTGKVAINTARIYELEFERELNARIEEMRMEV